ncbi:MAG: DUF58 domain-containing protein [Candidatus Melainabacteria bacterium]|nr:DUF58 domain-containing protein [Candidatus Melainabacteria bacterium]
MTASARLYLILILAMVPFSAAAWLPTFASQLTKVGLAIDILLLIAVIFEYQITPRTTTIRATRNVEERLSIGRENKVTIELNYTGQTPLKCQVKDDAPSALAPSIASNVLMPIFSCQLKPAQSTLLSYVLQPRKRGSYKFGKLSVRYLSRLGLTWREIKFDLDKDIKVFSDLKALHELSVKLSHSSELGELHQKKRGQGTEFASLREYAVGDDSKAIDWNATARRDRPVVRTYETEQEQRLLILVDAGRMMVSDLDGLTRFDRALNAALCLALTGLTHNDQVGIGIFADRPLLYLPPKRGKLNMNRILEATFSVEPRMVEPDYAGILSYFASAQKGRSLMVVLTDLTDPTGSQALLSGLASLAPRHLPFCVTLKDRQVVELANSNAEALKAKARETKKKNDTVEAIYKKAIAIDLLSQRELALSVLTRRGCLVLDCPPQDLSDKLVEKYLEVKSRARL